MADKLDFLDEEPKEEAITEEPVELAEPAPEEVTAAPEDKGEEPAAPPAAEPEKPHDVPITALLDEREKRQSAQRELDEIRKQNAALTQMLQQMQQKPEEKPDFFTDPEAALAARVQPLERQIEQRLAAQKLEMSRVLAIKDFGEETVNEVIAFFDQYPAESQKMMGEALPFHSAVKFMKRQKALEAMGEDPEAWIEQQVQSRLTQAQPVSPQKPAIPPTSMASAPSAGGEPKSSGSAFTDVFPR